jgi:hypothetical protein
MRCKTKQRKGSRPDLILGYRRTTATVAAVYDRRIAVAGRFTKVSRDE